MPRFYLIFILLILFTSCQSKDSCTHTKYQFNCVKYVSNYDGDTIKVTIPNVHSYFGEEVNVRVYGVDTPELRTNNKCEKKLAINAKLFIKNELKKADKISLKINPKESKDKYGRILSNVIYDGKDLSKSLLNNNLAYLYDAKTKKKIDWCLIK